MYGVVGGRTVRNDDQTAGQGAGCGWGIASPSGGRDGMYGVVGGRTVRNDDQTAGQGAGCGWGIASPSGGERRDVWRSRWPDGSQ
jgi:hypothetical protein